MRKYVLITGDWHCGHRGGLTPPAYWEGFLNSKDPHLKKTALIQKHIWDFYKEWATKRKWDVVFHLGDMIDGKGQKSGGNEQITTDRLLQIEMAVEAAQLTRAKKFRIVRGTKFHVGDSENFEDAIAKRIGAEIKNHGFWSVEGVGFDLKHKVGGSTVPHGGATPLLKSKLWSILWAERGIYPKAQLLGRGHVHSYLMTQDMRYLDFTAPCLQWGSEYGEQQCEKTIDLGIIEMVCNKGAFTFEPHILNMEFAKPEMEAL
jgi:hypothetical protein